MIFLVVLNIRGRRVLRFNFHVNSPAIKSPDVEPSTLNLELKKALL